MMVSLNECRSPHGWVRMSLAGRSRPSRAGSKSGHVPLFRRKPELNISGPANQKPKSGKLEYCQKAQSTLQFRAFLVSTDTNPA